jgi:nickel/cobalt transporter (NiCoT) family protein
MEALTLALLALALGARHGLDADHVAVIDSLTRHNAGTRPRLAAGCGALFALGHGSVVLTVAAVGVALGRAASPPAWLEATGAWISITLLLTLGLLNLRAGWSAAHVAAPRGLRARAFGRLLGARHPAGVAGVGAAFAVSFDTVSQTLLLVSAAAAVGGASLAGAAAGLFVSGMLLVDGAGGWWAWRWLRGSSGRVDGVAQRLALWIGAINIAMAALGAWRLHLGPDHPGSDAHDLALTAALLLLTPLAAVAAQRWRRAAAPSMKPPTTHPAIRGDRP